MNRIESPHRYPHSLNKKKIEKNELYFFIVMVMFFVFVQFHVRFLFV